MPGLIHSLPHSYFLLSIHTDTSSHIGRRREGDIDRQSHREKDSEGGREGDIVRQSVGQTDTDRMS